MSGSGLEQRKEVAAPQNAARGFAGFVIECQQKPPRIFAFFMPFGQQFKMIRSIVIATTNDDAHVY
ncbi:hypothetical protein [Azospirillum sp. TSO22-1]|uniref:hypothetical protein n=1 Tax=Azospirillum sp. TSO22-1 TaxID=716789 RepID=UPI0011B41BCF|nr:hypothetical protein [Azospirillum sp. TSO22-1]